MSPGYVYVLSNKSMPGLVKIGRSIHGGRKRADDIYRNATGVPTPFEMVFEIYTEDCRYLEAAVHEALQEWRVDPDREFFKVEGYTAVQAIIREHEATGNSTLVDTNELIDPADLYLMARTLENQFGEHQYVVFDIPSAFSYIEPKAILDALKKWRELLAKHSKPVSVVE